MGGGGREEVWRWGKSEITCRDTVTSRMTPALKMGSDEIHVNVSLTVRDKVTRQCPQTTTFEEKGELKQNRILVPVFTSLPPSGFVTLGTGA